MRPQRCQPRPQGRQIELAGETLIDRDDLVQRAVADGVHANLHPELQPAADPGRQLGVTGKSPGVTRRNVITSGRDLNSLVGMEFEIQGVRFLGTTECSPCHWMDEAIAPGAERLLHARGGLRAKILTDGILRVDA